MTRTALLVALATGCSGGTDDLGFTAAELDQLLAMSPRPPVPADPTNAVADDPEAALLGQRLYFDTRLSANGEVACATCHQPDLGYADGLQLAEGIGTTGRHAPSVLDAAYNRWQFWDGRADSLWSQALGPLENPIEHGTSRMEVARLLAEDPVLQASYEDLFGPLPAVEDTSRFPEGPARPDASDPEGAHNLAWESMSADDQDAIDRVFSNAGKAIAAYERLIVLGDAPFDDFVAALAADDAAGMDAISESAQRGAKLFAGAAGCTSCHFGPNLSNLEFHNVGLGDRDWLAADKGRWDGIEPVMDDRFNGMGPYSDDPDAAEVIDKLAYLRKYETALGAFKVPSLRPVALTAPYMHGGHFDTLEEVLAFYSALDEVPVYGHREETLQQVPLDEQDIADMVAFLESLAGELPAGDLLEPPP
jgi:cytochrome c peroxidase